MRTALTNGDPVRERVYHVQPRTYRLKQEALLCHKIMLAEQVEQQQQESGKQQVETAMRQTETAELQTEIARQQEETRGRQSGTAREQIGERIRLKSEAGRQLQKQVDIAHREEKGAEKINAAKAVVSIAAAVSSGRLDPSLADLDQALRSGSVDAATEAVIDRSRRIAAQAYGLLGRASRRRGRGHCRSGGRHWWTLESCLGIRSKS